MFYRFIILIIGLIVFSASCNGLQTPQKDKGMTLVVASYIPVGYDPYLYPGMKLFVDMVNERGKGTVRLDIYWGGTLLRSKQLLPGLQAGSADMIFVPSTYLVGSFPVLGMRAMPLWDELYDSYQSLKIGSPLAVYENKILEEKNIIQLSGAGVLFEFLWTRDKVVRRVEDMKGLKIRVPGKVQARIIQSLGAIPVTLPSAELPQALQRGVVDGAIMNPWTAQGRGIEEYCKYILIHPICGISNSIYVMNDVWNSWPEKVRNVILEAAVEYERKLYGSDDSLINENQLENDLIPFFEGKGMEAVYLRKEDVRDFKKAIKPAVEWWVREVGPGIGKKMLGYINYDM